MIAEKQKALHQAKQSYENSQQKRLSDLHIYDSYLRDIRKSSQVPLDDRDTQNKEEKVSELVKTSLNELYSQFILGFSE